MEQDIPVLAGRLGELVQSHSPVKGATEYMSGSHVVQSLQISHNPQP